MCVLKSELAYNVPDNKNAITFCNGIFLEIHIYLTYNFI